MKMKARTTLLLCLLFTIAINSQNWKGYDINSKAGIISSMVVGNINDTIYVSGNDAGKNHGKNSFIYSKDKGVTWSASKGILNDNNGYVAQYVGIKDRLYASIKLPTSDYVYHYSKDNGNTWVLDTIGLPHYFGSKSFQKDAFNLQKLGDEHIVAYNGLVINSAYYKKIGDASWKPLNPTTSKVNSGFTSIGNTWFSLNTSFPVTDDKFITKSTDNGVSWQSISKTGLPSTMLPKMLVSNGVGRLFLGASIAGSTNKTAVYYSDDNGETWVSTNAETLVPYVNGKQIINIYAANNQLIVTYSTGFNEPPLFLYSNTATPNFITGDSSGLINFPFAFPHVFFHIDDSIYLNHGNELHSMENITLDVKTFAKDISISVYPNPIKNQLVIKAKKDFLWRVTTILGKTILSGHYQTSEFSKKINFESFAKGIYIFSTTNGYSKKIVKQ